MQEGRAANGENWLYDLYSKTMRPFLFGNLSLFEVNSDTSEVGKLYAIFRVYLPPGPVLKSARLVATHHYRKQIEEDIKGRCKLKNSNLVDVEEYSLS